MDPITLQAVGTSGAPGGMTPPAPPSGSAAIDPASPAAPTGEQTPSAFRPAYHSQLDGRLQTREIYDKLAMTGGPNITHLADAYLKSQEEISVFAGRTYLPGKDATPEELKAFRTAFGVPETREGFQFDRTGDLGTVPSLPGLDDFYADTFIEVGLSKEQGEKLDKALRTKTLELIKAAKEGAEAKAKDGVKELQKRWGRDYDQKRLDLEKTLADYYGPEVSREILASPLANNPDFLDLTAGLRKYMADAVIHKGGGGSGDANPWDPKTLNLTKQMQIVKENPALARELAKKHGQTLI